MIYRDDLMCVVQHDKNNPTAGGDGGDSASRNGILACFDNENPWLFPHLFVQKGFGVRHPIQPPWNNPGNFTRDQLIPLVAGLSRVGYKETCESLFWSHAFRFFFAQNIDRDYPVISRKHPYPHQYQDFDTKYQKFSWFDYRDPLMPDDIWHLAKCAGLWWHWVFAIIGAPWLAMTIYFTKDGEINSLLCKAKVAGPWFVTLMKVHVPWEKLTDDYWSGWRDQKEIAEIIKAGF